MNKKCEYRHCQFVRPYFDNKTKYCDDNCRYSEKLERQKDQNNEKKILLNEFKRIESLLRVCYRRYGDKPFDINVIREMRMSWSVTSGEIERDNVKYTKVGSYAYAVSKDNFIIIIKI